MTSLRAAALALALLPVAGAAVPCESKWYARVCGDERYTVQSWDEALKVEAAAGETSTVFLSVPAAEPSVDVKIDGSIASGDGAALALVDVDMLLDGLSEEQENRLAEILIACLLVPDVCREALDDFLSDLPDETYQAASAWWMGCAHKDGGVSKSIADLERNAGGYVLAASAKAGSSARATLTVTHATPREVTATVCAPTQSGPMPSGTLQHRLVGTVSLAVAPQHGGTISNVRVSVTSPVAVGTFTVEGASIYFTGSSSLANCPARRCPPGTTCCEPVPGGAGCFGKCVKPPQVCP